MKKFWLVVAVVFSAMLAACSGNKESNQIRVAVSPASPPMLYESNGKIMGVDNDIFSAYCK